MGTIPPRIVILDNDQTTGDYDVFFKWLNWLEVSNIRNFINIAPILVKFICLFEREQIFRPGLKKFLRRLATLKQEGKIDYVVIYTNQTSEQNTVTDVSGLPITIPKLLEIIYNALSNSNLIDLTLTRPHTGELTKSFSRVFSALGIPLSKWKASKTLFFDDLLEHCPKTNDVTDAEKGHVRVKDYRTPFNSSLFMRMCRITVSYAINKPHAFYSRQMMNDDMTVAAMSAEILENENNDYRPKRPDSFVQYMPFIEKTFNDYSHNTIIEV